MNRILSRSAVEEILTVLRKHQVPLQPSVALICKVNEIPLHWIAERCGFHRNSLYKALIDEIRPHPVMVESVKEALGVDPWSIELESNYASR